MALTSPKRPAAASRTSSQKRARAETDEDEAGPSSSAKQAKTAASPGKAKEKSVHPIFARKDTTVPPLSSTSFSWLSPLRYRDGAPASCHHGVHLVPKSSTKVAAFDLDGTLIRPKNFGKFPKDEHDWEFWWKGKGNQKVVPNKLKELVDDGYAIVIISNQAIPSHIKTEEKRKLYTGKWQRKIPLLAAQLPDIPFRIFAATAKDQFRKPLIGTWLELERIFAVDGIQIDLASSFYVGDAAGRSGDHNVTDRLFALNAGLPFYTPEEFFIGQQPLKYKIERFHPSSIADDSDLPLYTPTSTPIVPARTSSDSKSKSKAEIVLFIGYPSAGKTTFFNKHFKPAGYAHVNQDTLKSMPKCLQMVKQCVAKGQSCVIDNTNRDAATRVDYIDIAQSHKVPIRAFYFSVSMDLAWHLNIYRAFWLTEDARSREPPRTMVPYTVYTSFKKEFQMPSKDEGFDEVKTINWIFEGGEAERKRFDMYLDVF